jgi:hypothetical protein
MGDNIMFLQMLPAALRANGPGGGDGISRAVVAFLDFRKAYDTGDRDFLLQIMDVCGAEAGLTS